MRKWLNEYLFFTRRERLGLCSLSILSVGFFFLPSLTRSFLEPPPTDFSEFQSEVLAFKTAFDHPENQAARPAELFAFDPNTASFDDFVRLGLDERISNRILNYRAHGGHFDQADDFQKIYGLQPDDFERLRPFIALERATDQPFTQTDGGQKTAAVAFPFDPNLASKTDFLRLGLSEKTAQTILNYRSKGGVFRKKEDFSTIYGLKTADFERLVPFIELAEKPTAASARPVNYSTPSEGLGPIFPNYTTEKKHDDFGPRKIDINRATAEDWKRLPGVGDGFAAKIMGFREKLGGFYKIEQVAETRGLADSTFQKMRGWLEMPSPVFRKINLNSATAEQLKSHPYFDRRVAEAVVAYRENHGPFKNLEELRAVRAIPKPFFELIFPYLTIE